MNRLFAIGATLVIVSIVVRAQDPLYYRRMDTWQNTFRASVESLTLERTRTAARPKITLGEWIAIGPFRSASRKAFSEVFPPETEFAPEKVYGDGSIRWTRRGEWVDGSTIMFPQTDFAAMYLSRSVASPLDTTLVFSLGSDDGIKVWMDGALVLQHETDRGVEPDQEMLRLPLKAGDHRLLLKINNGGGAFGFYFALVDEDLRTLRRLVERDFHSPEHQQQMAWERQDSIWALPWTPGDFAALARRYAGGTLFDSPSQRDSAVRAAEGVTTASGLESARTAYLNARAADAAPVILTPRPPDGPRINGPSVFGVRPGHPFLYTIPATGLRPMEFSARGLPLGLAMDRRSGHITGTASTPGRYTVSFTATNKLGASDKIFTIVVGDTIALTPPLGWNSWNCFASAVDDAKVRAAADAMVNTGLINHGWTYINIDDCWEIKPGSADSMLAGEPRTPTGMINTNRKFPDMKGLGDYIHGKGLKLGIYSSPGPLTCAGFTASYHHERLDALQYAAWGVDYLKYDWCSYGTIEKERTVAALQKPYRVMRSALDAIDRDIVYSLCQYGMGSVWEWGGEVGGNCWRTTGDIEDTWESMTGIGFAQNGHEKYAKPGNWNDPDMLVVGKVGWGPLLHPTRLTPNEQYTHITLWSLLSSPLLIGCDMTQMDDFTLSLLTNDEVIAINQDALGRQASRVSKSGDREVWAKDLADGSKAVGLFNRGKWKEEVRVSFADLKLQGKQKVRDVWRQDTVGEFSGEVSRSVARHGAVLLKITPVRQ